MMSGGNMYRATRNSFAVQPAVVLSFYVEPDVFGKGEIEFLAEIDQHIMVIQLPERRQELTSLRTPVLHLIPQPYFIITGIPDPGLGLCGMTIEQDI